MPVIAGQRPSTPLAALLRPATLDDVVGQEHLVGPGAPIRKMVERDAFVSSIIWGPPGSGKTSIVRAAAAQAKARFIQINVTSSGVADIRKALKTAEADRANGKRTIIFIDECLPYNSLVYCRLGDGTVTEKPIGEIVAARLRCEVLSVNLETDRYEWRSITSWVEQVPKEMVEVEIEDGGNTRLLRCSASHPVYTRNRGWVAAEDLACGDEPVVFCKDNLQEIHNADKPLQDMP